MNDAQRRALLAIARNGVEAEVLGRPRPPLDANAPDLPGFGGTFVTLHTGARLRGCIGTLRPTEPLPVTIQRVAAEATHDPRFLSNPIRRDDLPGLDVEISILSPMQRTNDPLSLELGVHGIYIRSGLSGGCFLPQVARERPQWTKEDFLSHCCEGKAGLRSDSWRDPQTEVYLFTAEVFNERQMRAEFQA